MILIVALAFDHLLNHAGVPAFVNRIPVLVGAFTVSAVSMRLIFAVAASAGVQLLNYADDQGWVYNNVENVRLVNEFLAGNPALCVGLILFTFAASMVLGGLSGWLLARVTLRLTPVLILMVTLGLTDVGCVLGRNTIWAAGGTMGVSVPDLLAFMPGMQHAAWIVILIAIVIGVYFLLERLEASSWGRRVAAAGDNPITAASVGKDVVRIRGDVVFHTSGIMALAGALWGFYYLFVVESSFHNWPWLFLPLVAITLGGPGGRWRIIVGTGLLFVVEFFITSLSHMQNEGNFILQSIIFFPISYLEDVFLALFILLAFTRLPKIMSRRRTTSIKGIHYEDAVEAF